MSHHDPLLAFNLAIEHATFPILPTVKILKKETHSIRMKGETSAPYKVSQRPPP